MLHLYLQLIFFRNMDLSNVKLVVTDMDGTLLNSNHEVSNRFFELFKKLKHHNILFVVASGRQRNSILDKLAAVENDIIVVAENGGLVTKNDEVLLSTAIENKNIVLIDNLLKTIPDVNAVYCTKDRAYTSSKSEKLLGLLNLYYSNFKTVDSIYDVEEPIYKIALYHEISSEQYLYPHLKHLEANFKVKVSANHWVDISESNANKGYALQLIQKMHGISPNETLAFGDYNNDIEMLNSAYYSYAMENAHPFVKETANFMTKTNDEFGVEAILQLLVEKLEVNG